MSHLVLSYDGIVTSSGTGLKGESRETVRPDELLDRTLAERDEDRRQPDQVGRDGVNYEAAAWHPPSGRWR